MRPIRVYLDTSDYAAMYCAPSNGVTARLLDELLRMKEGGRIEIGLSYHVVFELLQKAEPKFRADRLARARLLTRLCGQNAFPYPTDVPQGYRFSREGLWVPRIWLEEIEVERIVQHAIETMTRCPFLNRRERRALSKRSYFVEWVRSNPSRFLNLFRDQWPLLFGKISNDSGDFIRYILGEMTQEQADAELRFYITDPVTVYETWFENYGKENPLPSSRDPIAELLGVMIKELNTMLDEHAALKLKVKEAMRATGDDALSAEGREAVLKIRRDLKGFRREITAPAEMAKHPAWKRAVGDEGALLAAQVFHAFRREKRAIKPSDAIDLIHTMYLPHTDLWRGDKAFGTMLIKHRVNFHERIVPALVDLPLRIETEIASGRAQ